MSPQTDIVLLIDAWEHINPPQVTGVHCHMRKTHPQFCKYISQLIAPGAGKAYSVYHNTDIHEHSHFLSEYPTITNQRLASDTVERVWCMGFHMGRCIENWIDTTQPNHSHIEYSIVVNCVMPHPDDTHLYRCYSNYNLSVYSGNGVFMPINISASSAQ